MAALQQTECDRYEFYVVCDMCEEEGAFSYCDECEVKLGEVCQSVHSRQKATSSHIVLDVKSVKISKLNIKCSSCENQAAMFCPICQETLCEKCSTFHQKLKITKMHELFDMLSSTAVVKESCFVSLKTDNMKSRDDCESMPEKTDDESRDDGVSSTNVDTVTGNARFYDSSDRCDVPPINDQNYSTDSCDQVPSKCETNKPIDNNDVTSSHTKASTPSDNSDVVSPNTGAIEPSDNNAILGPNTGGNNPSDNSNVVSPNTGSIEPSDNNAILGPNTGGNNPSDNSDVVSPNTRAIEPSDSNAILGPNTGGNNPSDKKDVISPNTGANSTSDNLDIQCDSKDKTSMSDCLGQQTNTGDTFMGVCKGITGERNSPEIDMVPESVEIHRRTNASTATTVNSGPRECQHATTPGKPYTRAVSTDYIHIAWVKPEKVSETDTYQVKYKEETGRKWIFYPAQFEQNQGKVDGLKSDTSYTFNVRTVHSEGESPYSESSDVIKTNETFASHMVHVSHIVGNEDTTPKIYAMTTTHMRTNEFMSKKHEIGPKSKHCTTEKTIMLLGATGTGKSTLVDGIANYVLGVNFNDPYRFTVFDTDERKRQSDQAISQTDWITCYSFNPQKGTRTNYQLNVIDTPGFADTRGLERDQLIVDQIRHLFEQTGEMGVQNIDAVCFLVKAPDARLTTTQRYIFNAIMSIFGNDIQQNICTLITFADGSDPPVLSAIKGSGLPFGKYFTFNNSALFAQTAAGANTLAPMFWDMGKKSFEAFFDHLQKTETKSIQLTKEVLQERHRLEVTIQNLQPQIDTGLSTIQLIRDEMKLFEENEATIKANKDFAYTVTEMRQEKIDLPPGTHVTNCLQCNMTCHEKCMISDDDEKAKCVAMDSSGTCQQCHDNCHWSQHKNARYIFKYVGVTVEKTYNNMLEKYQEAKGKHMSLKQLLDKMNSKLEELTAGIEDMMEQIKDCNNRLKEIALMPNPLGMKDLIELMILSEEKEQKEGHLSRIRILQVFLKKATIQETVKRFHEEKSNLHKSTQAVGKKWPSGFDKVRKFFGLGK